ncbi:threonine synthase [Treponema sp. OMZ 838]|uniref:pyridoxal-phosphate dependent enzyme n=1 Tax=Treponema sp. OMZ 838 TaxID=1539298 RepID=UPI0005300D50|nr:pyridoxal-phosphate dependent enzyme [Treponema sp. OMZ 838]AIW89351.1 threonine synthase [Treponema sp. OMZ 838]
MKLVSTRNSTHAVSFKHAIFDCMPADGGLYVPYSEHDLRSWILHMNEQTAFSTIAGSLTSALLKEEISPVISERIAATAFQSYSPRLRQLDDRLFLLELFHGPTGNHRDFGFLWLASALEHLLTIDEKNAIVVAPSTGAGGRSMATAFGNKKHLKLVILYPKGYAKGLKPEHLFQNGGSVYPVEVDGDIAVVENLIRSVYQEQQLVKDYNLTLANTVNIGRILPQVFFYMFAFTRIKTRTAGEIFYAVPSGNYGNLAAGLYAWKFRLPVNGFITDATDALNCDETGYCRCINSSVPLAERGPADPAVPSSIERLEQIFTLSPAIMKSIIFPAKVSDAEAETLISDSYRHYGIMFDTATAHAYAAAQTRNIFRRRGGESLVLVSKDHPAFESEILTRICGESPIIPEYLRDIDMPLTDVPLINGTKEELIKILNKVSEVQ